MSNLPFLEEILADLRRFKECVEDGQDVDLDRGRFDLLTQLGLLERTQRSPARWMMTQAGEDAIAQPATSEPIYQLRNPKIGPEWHEVDQVAYNEFASMPAYERRTLWTAPPAAAHGHVPSVSGIGRYADHPRALVLYLRSEPTDDEIRAIQEALRGNAASHGDEAVRKPELAGYFSFCEDKQKWLQQRSKGAEFNHLFTPLYAMRAQGDGE